MSDSSGQHTPFKSKKVTIIVENKFIPEEVSAYQTKFPEFGARVELISGNLVARVQPESAEPIVRTLAYRDART
jgi:hypothetical protein